MTRRSRSATKRMLCTGRTGVHSRLAGSVEQKVKYPPYPSCIQSTMLIHFRHGGACRTRHSTLVDRQYVPYRVLHAHIIFERTHNIGLGMPSGSGDHLARTMLWAGALEQMRASLAETLQQAQHGQPFTVGGSLHASQQQSCSTILLDSARLRCQPGLPDPTKRCARFPRSARRQEIQPMNG